MGKSIKVEVNYPVRFVIDSDSINPDANRKEELEKMAWNLFESCPPEPEITEMEEENGT